MIKDKFGNYLVHGNTKYGDFYDYFWNELPAVDYVPLSMYLEREEYKHLLTKCMYLPYSYNGEDLNPTRIRQTLSVQCRDTEYKIVYRTIGTDFMIWKMRRK